MNECSTTSQQAAQKKMTIYSQTKCIYYFKLIFYKVKKERYLKRQDNTI